MCDKNFSHAWRDYSHAWRDSCVRVTWLIHVCDITRVYVWYDSFIWLMYLRGILLTITGTIFESALQKIESLLSVRCNCILPRIIAINTQTRTHTHTHTQTRARARTHTHTRTHTLTHTHTHLNAQTHTHTHAHAHTHAHTHTPAHTHTRIHIRIHLYTYTHTYKYAYRLYGVATISRLLKMICLFCKRAL